MVLLLPAAWLACFFIFRELGARNRIRSDLRLSFVLASTAWGALLTLGTELLSLLTAVNALAVMLFWVFANVAVWGGLVLWRRRSPVVSNRKTIGAALKELKAWPLDAKLILAAAGAFALFLGGIALFTPTTNWDSMTYHLPRVMHWVQQQSIAHYPTNMISQIQMGPWSAFAQTHLWLLCGGDRFANLVQWAAMVGCAAVASLLAKEILPSENPAATARVQAFAALLVVTLPTGIVEAVSTQTDFVTAFWLMCSAGMALAWAREPEKWIYAVGYGVTLGLGVLTKLTFVLFGAPVGMALVAALIAKQRQAISKMLVPAVSALVVCLALAAPHLLRNQKLFGSAVGATAQQEYRGMAKRTPAAILSNLIRNTQLHVTTCWEPLNHQLNRVAGVVQSWTGIAPNDREVSNFVTLFEPGDNFFVFDSYAASPWHVALIGIAGIVGLVTIKKNRLPLLALTLAFVGFALFCSVFRWEAWNSRYHLPALVLAVPAVAALLVPWVNRWVTATVATGIFVFAIVIVANNRSRPVFDAAWRAQPRMQQMFGFMHGTRFYGPMQGAVAQIMATGCEEVGVKMLADEPEYPLWLMLREAGFKGRIQHVLVEGPPANLPGPSATPDVIIITAYFGKPTGAMATAYPSATEIGSPGGEPVYKLYWSIKMTERRAQMKN